MDLPASRLHFYEVWSASCQGTKGILLQVLSCHGYNFPAVEYILATFFDKYLVRTTNAANVKFNVANCFGETKFFPHFAVAVHQGQLPKRAFDSGHRD